jgi:hypothetical protein
MQQLHVEMRKTTRILSRLLSNYMYSRNLTSILVQYGCSLFLSQGCKRSHLGVGEYRYRNTNFIKMVSKCEGKATKTYVGVKLQLHLFLTSTINGGKWSASRSSSITPGKAPHLPNKKEVERAREPLWTLCSQKAFCSCKKSSHLLPGFTICVYFLKLKPTFFWDIMQHRCGTIYRSHLRGWTVRLLNH